MDGVIATDNPSADDVRALLEVHLAFNRAASPPEDVHALDIDELLDPAVSFYSYRVDGKLLGLGAVQRLDAEHAELKSMHTAQAARGQGVGKAMVRFLVDLARERGYERVSIETGSMDEFAPARAMYAQAGFEPCEPFGDYALSPTSTFMTLALR
jgi:putative acetyltransferase